MEEIKKIPFMGDFFPLLDDGTKTWTTRTKAYGKVGDRFEVPGHPGPVFELVEVKKVRLCIVAITHWKEEGCKSAMHFIKVWNGIHPRKTYETAFNDEYTVHVFKRVL